MNLLDKLRLSCNRAMLFNILPIVRFIFTHIDRKKLTISIYVDRDLNSYEKDIYYSMAGEIGGDFPELNDSLTKVVFIVSDKKFEELSEVGNLVYARFEN